MQFRRTLFIEKPSPTKNLHCRAPIPEVDEDDPFLIADVFEIKAHEEPLTTLSTDPEPVSHMVLLQETRY